MTRKIKTKQLIHTFLVLLSLLLRGLKVPNKAGGSQVSQGEATQDYLPLENTSSWKIWRKTVLWLQFVSLSSVSHLHGKHLHGNLEGAGTGTAAGWQSGSPCGCHLDFPAEETPWEWLPGGLEGLKGLPQALPS